MSLMLVSFLDTLGILHSCLQVIAMTDSCSGLCHIYDCISLSFQGSGVVNVHNVNMTMYWFRDRAQIYYQLQECSSKQGSLASIGCSQLHANVLDMVCVVFEASCRGIIDEEVGSHDTKCPLCVRQRLGRQK